MDGSPKPSGTRAIIRVGQAIQISWAIAIAAGLLLSLHAFVLVGWLTTTLDTNLPAAYLLSIFLFLPPILTYAERTISAPGSRKGDILDLVGAGGSRLRTFVAGWLLLLGALGLVLVLGQGLGQILSVLGLYFGQVLAVRWLAAASIVLLGLFRLLGAGNVGQRRTILVYAGLGLVLLVATWSWLKPAVPVPVAKREPAQLWNAVALLATGLWGLDLLLDYRRQVRQPRKAWLPILLIPLAAGGLLGVVTSALEGYPHLWAADLAGPARLAARLSPELLEAAYLVAGLVVLAISLNAVLGRTLRLLETMRTAGFLPGSTPAAAGPSLIGLTAGGALLAAAVPLPLAAGLASLAILWTTALLNGPDLLGLGARSGRKTTFQLPFYPLFPGLATVIGLLLSFALPLHALLVGGGWLGLGLAVYLYLRRRWPAQLAGWTAFREDTAVEPEVDFCVVVAITSPYVALPLLRAGARLASVRCGRLIALQVLEMAEQMPQKVKELHARQQMEIIEDHIQRAGIDRDSLSVQPYVRVAADTARGIVDTVREERADLLLLAWQESRRRQVMEQMWQRVAGERQADDVTAGPEDKSELNLLLDAIVQAVSCDVAILRGQLPGQIERVLVPASGSSSPATALKLGRALIQSPAGQLTFLHVLADDQPTAPRLDEPRMQAWLTGLESPPAIEARIIQADSVQAGILNQAHDYDLLLMGASNTSLLAKTHLGLLPVQVAQARRLPTLLLRPAQARHWLWMRRIWQALTGIFAALTPQEREAVSAQMRQAAQPSVNFFVLITLAATIATLGLLQNSAAVIIGAMLVAPLMSPIASTAMGIVEGDTNLIRVSAEAVLKGVTMAVGVGIAITLVSPRPLATTEILSRTQPNLLDLVVALASGAAAGYALSRKEVIAALPGVSIAVALVPPLCVVGYGIAAARFEIAGGAFLLFATNVIAIVLAAVAVFLILGFRPLPAQQEQFRRGLVVSIASLIVIAIPLSILLNISFGRIEHERRRAALTRDATVLLTSAIPADRARVVDVMVTPDRSGYLVEATIYDFDFAIEQIAELEKLLNERLEEPVTLRATVLSARSVGSEGRSP